MMKKNILYTGGLLLAGLLLTACSNGDWEDNLPFTNGHVRKRASRRYVKVESIFFAKT